MPEQEFVSDTTGRETVQSDLRPVIDEIKQAITQALAERPRTPHVNMVTDSGNQSQSTRGHSQTPGLRNTSPGPRSPSPGARGTQSNRDRNQTGYQDQSPSPRYNGSRRNDSPGPRQGYDGQNSRLDHAMSHLVLHVITTRGLDRITSRLGHVMTIGPHSTMDLRHQETSVG